VAELATAATYILPIKKYAHAMMAHARLLPSKTPNPSPMNAKISKMT
jgi:hypothetical protein